jgi:hypothetical protein
MTRVPSDVPRVTFFSEILKWSWNQIIRVNPLPRGASAGEFGKTCHPRNVEVNEICEVSFQEQGTREDLESETHEVLESRTRVDLESETHEVLESQTREDLESETHEVSESRMRDGLESWTCEASKSRIRKDSKSWTYGATNFENLWNSGVW